MNTNQTKLSLENKNYIYCGVYAEQKGDTDEQLEIQCLFYNKSPEKQKQLSSLLYKLIEPNIILHPILKIKIKFYFLINTDHDFSNAINLYTKTILKSGIGIRYLLFSSYFENISLCSSDEKIYQLILNGKIEKCELKNKVLYLLEQVKSNRNYILNEIKNELCLDINK